MKIFKAALPLILTVVCSAQFVFGPGGGGGVGAANLKGIAAGPATSVAIDITSLGLTAANLNTLVMQCWSGAGFDANGPTGTLTPIIITSVNPRTITSATANFSSSSSVGCVANSNGGVGPVGTQGTQGIQGIQGSQGIQGAGGTNGTNGQNGATWLTGAGVPSNGSGSDGDYYLRQNASSDVYHKVSSSWGAVITSLRGTTGVSLLNGIGAPSNGIGNDGDFYIDTAANNIYGPKVSGAWASGTSIIGTNGINGTNGTNGINGINGIQGIQGVPGTPGAQPVNLQTGTTYTFVNTDCGKLVSFTNAASIAASVPQANSGGFFVDDCNIAVQNRGLGTLTLTFTVSSLDNSNTPLPLTTGQGFEFSSKSGNYYSQRGMTGGGNGATAVSVQNGSDFSLTETSTSGSTYTMTASPTMTVYPSGGVQVPLWTWLVVNSCTAGGMTMSIDGLASHPVIEPDGTDPTVLDCAAGQHVVLTYDAFNLKFVIVVNGLSSTSWHGVICPEASAPTGVSGYDFLFCDSGLHRLRVNLNNGGPATLLLPIDVQSGVSSFVTETSTSATVYTGTMSPTLTALSTGMAVNWTFTHSCTGATSTTVNVDGLGAKRLFLFDGTSNPTAADCAVNVTRTLKYNSALNSAAGAFSLDGGPAAAGSGSSTGSTGDFQRSSGSGNFGAANINQVAGGNMNASKAFNWAAPNVATYTASGTTALDWSLSNVQKFTASAGDTTLSSTNMAGSGPYKTEIIQDSVCRIITFPSNMKGGVQPDCASGATTIQVWDYDGTNLLGGAVSVPNSLWHGGGATPVAFSNFPTCNSSYDGMWGPVTDGSTATLGAVVSGGGPFHEQIACNGTNWLPFLGLTAQVTRAIAFSIGDPGNAAALTTSSASNSITIPFACTISAYNLSFGAGDTGTITVKFALVHTGTAIPTSAAYINSSGVGIVTGTALHSDTVTDFSVGTALAIAKNDLMVMFVTAVSAAKSITGVIECL